MKSNRGTANTRRALRPWRAWVLLLAGGAGLAFFSGCLLPWAGQQGYAGKTVQDNLQEGRDASPLFYTHYEGMRAIEAQFEAAWAKSRE